MKRLYYICFIANALMLVLGLGYNVYGIYLFITNGNNVVYSFPEKTILIILTMFSCVLWFKNLGLAFTKDDGTHRFYIIFFNFVYNPFYFIRAIKREWI